MSQDFREAMRPRIAIRYYLTCSKAVSILGHPPLRVQSIYKPPPPPPSGVHASPLVDLRLVGGGGVRGIVVYNTLLLLCTLIGPHQLTNASFLELLDPAFVSYPIGESVMML